MKTPAPANPSTPELTRAVLATLGLLVLIVASLWVLQPFLVPLVWASTIVIATWPLMRRVEQALGGRRAAAVAVMTIALVTLLFLPLLAAVATVLENTERIIAWTRALSELQLGEAPAWLLELPLVGSRAGELWQKWVAQGAGALVAQISPYLGTVASRLLREAGALGVTAVQFVVTILIAGVLYARGETATELTRRFFRRLAGSRGEDAVQLAAASIRGVAMGVVVTAFIQALMGGAGLLAAGVPAAGVLTTLMFVFTIAQIGPMPILIPAVIWLYWVGSPVAASVLLVWTLLVGTIDNFIRPWLIRRGAEMPLLLVFAGVLGGLMAFGLIGLFIGPVVLLVTWRLLEAWMGEANPTGQPRLEDPKPPTPDRD